MNKGNSQVITGERVVIDRNSAWYPNALRYVRKSPESLYLIGNPEALCEGIAIVGARRATPYGIGCAKRFAQRAAELGVTVISGGARGCDAAAHQAALAAGGTTIVFLGGGCDRPYPQENLSLFQEVVDKGGALVSEHSWEVNPLPFMFRERNRLIAGLARATLIVEAGLPSGTFSTADEALGSDREVLVVPGAITSATSAGANRLLYQGATPIVDDETFADQMFVIFGCLRQETAVPAKHTDSDEQYPSLTSALCSQIMSLDELLSLATVEGECPTLGEIMLWLAQQVKAGNIAQYADGRYGPAV